MRLSTKDSGDTLLQEIKRRLPDLKTLQKELDGMWGGEDLVYRFYHQSFKVFYIQELTQKMVDIFTEIAIVLGEDWKGFSPMFTEIVTNGLSREFKSDTNTHWTAETRPMVEAFLHCRYFLDMMIRYGEELEDSPQMMPSGWAAIRTLYRAWR